MDPAVESTELTINMPESALQRVRGVDGVGSAVPIALGDLDVRFPNGRFQGFQVIGVDDATLAGAPQLQSGQAPVALHRPDAVIVDSGGTSGKLDTPLLEADKWPSDGPHLSAPTRELTAGDELLANDHRIEVIGRSHTSPRYPPRPLIYTTYANASRILPLESSLLTFIMVVAQDGVPASELAQRIQQNTGLRARTSGGFKEDTVHWYLENSEDVGDMGAMLTLAMVVGFGVTGVMLYIFTYENLKQYAVLKAMGASQRLLLTMIFAQAGLCGLLGTGIGIGLCAVIGEAVATVGYPFRMMWFTPLAGIVGVLTVSLAAAAISVRPVLKLEPGEVFAGR